jgi:hypothetical protein
MCGGCVRENSDYIIYLYSRHTYIYILYVYIKRFDLRFKLFSSNIMSLYECYTLFSSNNSATKIGTKLKTKYNGTFTIRHLWMWRSLILFCSTFYLCLHTQISFTRSYCCIKSLKMSHYKLLEPKYWAY